MKNNNLFLIKLSDGSTVDASEIPGVKIEFFGKNNCITIEEGSVFSNLHIKMRENSQVTIEKTHSRGIRNTVIDMAGSSNNRLVIMKNCSIESCRFSMANESNLSIEIGEDCMFSSNVVFRATDGHVIYDINSKSLLNQAKPISIGNHVWLGSGVTILKGTKILDNTVIGTGSVVTKAFSESNIVIAGTPARVVKNNIGWDRTYIDSFKNHNKSERTENMLRTDNDKKEIFCKK